MSLAYDYSQNGRLTSKIQKLTDNDAGQTTTYDYDLVGRLRSASTNNGGDTYNYTYDPNGNMKSRGIVGQGTRTYNYNKVNQLTCSYTGSSCVTTDPATLRYDYDQNGSLYTKITSAGSKAYRYNARNQMTSAAKETGGTSTMTYLDASSTERVTKDSMSYTYNLLGLSSQKPSGGSGTYFTRDDKSKLLEERVGNGTGFAHYYYLTDALGSVVAVTNAGGSKVGGGNYKYDPYGRTLNDPLANSGVSNPFGFVGGYTDSETGFVKFGTRYYDPSVARWTQQDPQKGQLSDPMSLNPYLYVKNDPLNAVDPSGRLSFFESFLAGVATTVGCGVFGLTTAGIGAGLAVFIGGPEAAPVGAAIGFPVGCELAGTAIGEFIDSNSS
jgi:RHS repeat-associated protein